MYVTPLLLGVAKDAIALEASSASPSSFDALVLVSASPIANYLDELALPAPVAALVRSVLESDRAMARGPQGPVVLPCESAAGKRVVLATCGALTDDIDDVRAVAETVTAAINRACASGAKKPLLAIAVPHDAKFARAVDVAALAALATQWHALEAREAGRAGEGAVAMGVVGLTEARADYLRGLEVGRALGRDITGTEPERMAPLRAAELCEKAFAETGVRVAIHRDTSRWPLLTAVARASNVVERHRPCVIELEYTPEGGRYERTLYLAGKGLTYDTGGADLKTGGSMAGMSRDKGGAGAVAAFVRACAAAKVKGVRVVALLGMVRNSIGEESFVSDEVIASHAGVRVRIGNTDAEGRLVLADLLSELRERAKSDSGTTVIASVATLTGHVIRAFGPYVGAIENKVARDRGVIATLVECGERWGEPMEWTRVRREDYAFCAPRSNAEDLVSSNRLASVDTARGHQGPFAFLDVASGLKNSGLAYVHLDIGGAAFLPLDWQFGRPTSAPALTLAAWCAGE
ncbi:MAG: aminopeptidase [Myxococcales bacterium]|nr:aminopeptidase [Myxococcales bacterium]